MRVLVTGGAGFIGSHLCDFLLARGCEVVCMDSLVTGTLDNIAHLRDPRFLFVKHDVTNFIVIDGDLDYVLHFASPASPIDYLELPIQTLKVGALGTHKALGLAKARGAKFLLASTSEVYGRNSKVPLSEDDYRIYGSTAVARWSYAASKAMDEFLALAYWRTKGLPVLVARFFNTVGPRQTGRYGMVIPRLIGQALRDEPMTIYGDGNQTRNFTYVGDVVRAVIALIDEPRAVGGIFNIGSEEEISINELAERIKRMTGSASQIAHIPYEEAYQEGFEDMERRVPDISKIRNLIGYRNTATLDEILVKVI
ncbi:MAG: nucleoside-diphosphate sugar epimerase, partial [Candidatus Rokuibacteriota bacterium]